MLYLPIFSPIYTHFPSINSYFSTKVGLFSLHIQYFTKLPIFFSPFPYFFPSHPYFVFTFFINITRGFFHSYFFPSNQYFLPNCLYFLLLANICSLPFYIFPNLHTFSVHQLIFFHNIRTIFFTHPVGTYF